MPRPSLGPLTDQHYKRINEALSKLAAVRQEIEKATEAGLPCGELDQECRDKQALLERLKKVYFPDRS